MERETLGDVVRREELLASGDASHPSGDLQINPSMIGLLTSASEEATIQGYLSYDDLSSADTTERCSLSHYEDKECPLYVQHNTSHRERHSHNLVDQKRCVQPQPCSLREKVILGNNCRELKRNIDWPKLSFQPKNAYDGEGVVLPTMQLQKSGSNVCVSGKPTMRLKEVAKLLTCQECGTMPMTSLNVHSCLKGHATCGHCFESGLHACGECKEALDGHNQILENVLQHLRQVCPRLFPQDSLARIDSELQIQLEKAISVSMDVKTGKEKNMNTLQHSSHRPVYCPHLYCSRMIASNGFLAHFEFEHPTVPVYQMSPQCFHQFGLPLQCLEDTCIRVVAIIEVAICENKCDVRRKQSCLTSVSRISAYPVRQNTVVCALLSATLSYDNNTFLAAWCTCLYEEEPPLSYCIKAHIPNGSQTCYSGPMRSLHHSQEPECIMKEAQCLIMAPGVFNHLFSQDHKSLYVELQFNLTS